MTTTPSVAFPQRRLAQVAEVRLGKMLQPNPTPGAVEVPYMRAGSLERLESTPTEELPKMWASPSELQMYKLRERDVLVAEGGDVGRSELAPSLSRLVIFQNSLHRLRARDGDNRFLRYAIQSVYWSSVLEVIVNRATFGHLTVEKLKSLQLPWPSYEEQREIADFLDRETARIDALIAKKHQMRDVLSKRTRTLISEVATGRFDVTSDKEFGHALHRRIGAFAEIQLGRQRTPKDDQGPDMVLYLRAANIKDGALDLSDVKQMNFSPVEQKVFALSPGDVLVTEGAGSLAAVGASAIWNGEIGETVCFQNTLIRLRPRVKAIRSAFLYWWARHAFGSGLFSAEATGANIFHLGADRLRAVYVTLPSLEGQKEVVAYLERATEKAQRLVSHHEAQLALLREHRQALITAAVTGQMDVLSAA